MIESSFRLDVAAGGFLKKMGFWFQVLGDGSTDNDLDNTERQSDSDEQSAGAGSRTTPAMQFITPVEEIDDTQDHNPPPPPVR